MQDMIRTATRSLAFLIPLCSLCLGMFYLPEHADIILGGVIGSVSTAGIFYYNEANKEDQKHETD